MSYLVPTLLKVSFHLNSFTFFSILSGTLKLDRFVLRVAFIVLLYLREGRKAFLVADKDTKGDTKVPCSDTQVLKGLETLINHKVIETKTIYDMFVSII